MIRFDDKIIPRHAVCYIDMYQDREYQYAVRIALINGEDVTERFLEKSVANEKFNELKRWLS